MKNYILIKIIFIILCFNSLVLAQAINVTQLFNIGNGKAFVCASDVVFGNFIGKKVTETSAKYINYRRARRKAYKKIRFFRKRKKARINSNFRRNRRLKNKIKNWRKVYRDLRRCWKYDVTFNSLANNQNPDIARACEIISPKVGSFRSKHPFARILNGNLCELNNSPIVKLKMYNNRGNLGSCSGTAVTKRAIITAAHCLDGRVSKIKVISQNQILESEDFYIHPRYGRSEIIEFNDVAVVLLNEDISTDIFKPIKYANLVNKELGIIAGYGYDEFFNAGNLIAAPILIDSSNDKGISIRFTNNNDFGNTCSGDSGGPLLIKRAGIWRLVGVTSNGIKNNCGAGDLSNFANLLDPDNISFLETYISNLYE